MGLGAGRWGALVLVPLLLAGCTDDGPGPPVDTPMVEQTSSAAQGGSGQGRGTSEPDRQVGFRVENATGAPITLVLRGGVTGTVAKGSRVTILRCRERLPIRALDSKGRLLDVRRGHCQGETWVVEP